MKLFNTLTRKLEEFKPIAPGKVKFYHCGPTVYWTQHIGNLMGMAMGDLLRRTLEYLGYKVTHVRNYTDVGHLTSDSDSGEDKMTKGARREHKTPQEIAAKYIRIFEKDTRALNLVEPHFKPRATEFIKEMQTMIQTLLDRDFAYITELAVYYDVSKFKPYYELSHQRPEAQRADLEDPQKRHSQDFALWFFKKGKHQEALQTWSSSWGVGFPGWHIECSVMSKALLGNTLDIHFGGVEHIPVHHTNEIAQSEAANGTKFVNYWLHNEHLLVNNRKMAKSEGTGFSLQEIIDRGYNSLDLRYFFLQAHYRSQQNFTWEALSAAKNARQNLLGKLYTLTPRVPQGGRIIQAYQQRFQQALEDNLNIPIALALVWELVDSKNPPVDILATAFDFDRVLGLKIQESLNINIPEKIITLAQERQTLRAAKKFSQADEIRQRLDQQGYLVEDINQGFTIRPKQF